MLMIIGVSYQLSELIAGDISTKFGADRASSGINGAHRAQRFHSEYGFGRIQEKVESLCGTFQAKL
jgi:hypothetical protein